MITRFFKKKWLQVLGFFTSYLKNDLLQLIKWAALSLLGSNCEGCEVSSLGEEGKRGERPWDQSTRTKEKWPFPCGSENLLLKGSPPHLPRIWHMGCATDGYTGTQLVSIWHSFHGAPCQLASSSLGLQNGLIPPSCYAKESREMLSFTNFPSKPF